MSSVLIIGAKSDIAQSLAKVYAKNGYDLVLAGRDMGDLKVFAQDLRVRYGVKCIFKKLDLVAFETHQAFYDALEEKPLGVLVVAGYMEEQKVCEKDLSKTLNTLHVNFTGAVSILNIVANDMEKKKQGFIVGVSSVAGDRGRKTNYIYGSAKAGFTAYLSGLRNRLFEAKVNVLTVKPGFVATKMTEGLDLPEKLTAQPDEVAEAVFKAQKKGRNVLYVKPIWWLVMLIIKHIPESIFKRLSI